MHSVDYDPQSVACARELKRRYFPDDPDWTLQEGSVLDVDFLRGLGTYNIVYSWGVLHHTGAMWDAIGNCAKLVAPGGLLWISLYAKGSRYRKDLALKKKFNASSSIGKRWMIAQRIFKFMLSRSRHLKNPFDWNQKVGRGMNIYHDIVDWLGGLPYETASEDEVVRFARQRGFILERIRAVAEGGCSVYVFSLTRSHDRN